MQVGLAIEWSLEVRGLRFKSTVERESIKRHAYCSSGKKLTWQILHFLSISEAKCSDASVEVASLAVPKQRAISSSFNPVLTYPILSPSSSNSYLHDDNRTSTTYISIASLARHCRVTNKPRTTCCPCRV